MGNILFFSSAHGIPHGDGLFCRGSACPCIADDPSDQSSVSRRQTVMFINIQLRQRTDINLKLALDRQGIGQLIVQAMDSSMTNTSSFPSVISLSLYSLLPVLKLKIGRLTVFPASSSFISWLNNSTSSASRHSRSSSPFSSLGQISRFL